MRARIVGVDGKPRGGKTTNLRIVVPRVREVVSSMEFIPDMVSWKPGNNEIEKNVAALYETGHRIKELQYSKELIVIERSPLSGLASILTYARLNRRRGRAIADAINLAAGLLPEIDLFILINISFAEARRRDIKAGGSGSGRIINPRAFPVMERCYQEAYRRVPACRIRTIEGEDDMRSNQDKIFSMITKLVGQKNGSGSKI